MYPVPRTLPIVSCLMLVLLGGAVSVASAASLCLEKGQVRLKQQFQLSGLHPDLTEEFCRRFNPEPSEVEIVRPRPPNAEDTPPTPAMSDPAPTVSNPTLSPVPLRDNVSVVKQDEEIPAPEPFASSLDNDTTVEDVLPPDQGITSSVTLPPSNTPDNLSSPEVSFDTPSSNISEPALPESPPTSPTIRNDRVDLPSAEKSSLFQGWGLGAAVTYTRTTYQEHQYAILMGGEGWELRGIQQQGNWLYGIAQSYASHQGSAYFGDVRGDLTWEQWTLAGVMGREWGWQHVRVQTNALLGWEETRLAFAHQQQDEQRFSDVVRQGQFAWMLELAPFLRRETWQLGLQGQWQGQPVRVEYASGPSGEIEPRLRWGLWVLYGLEVL